MLLNPRTQTYDHLDPTSRELMHKTIAFFENKGKKKLKADDHERVWNYDFVEFILLRDRLKNRLKRSISC